MGSDMNFEKLEKYITTLREIAGINTPLGDEAKVLLKLDITTHNAERIIKFVDDYNR